MLKSPVVKTLASRVWFAASTRNSLGDASHPVLPRGFGPGPHVVFLRSQCHQVPGLPLGIPSVEIIVMIGQCDKIFCPGGLVQTDAHNAQPGNYSLHVLPDTFRGHTSRPVQGRSARSSAPRCRTWHPGTIPDIDIAGASPTMAGMARLPSSARPVQRLRPRCGEIGMVFAFQKSGRPRREESQGRRETFECRTLNSAGRTSSVHWVRRVHPPTDQSPLPDFVTRPPLPCPARYRH